VVARVVRHLLLLWRWRTLELLLIGRLVRKRALGVGCMRRRVMSLRRTLCRSRMVGRVGVLLMWVLVRMRMLMLAVVEHSRPRVVRGMMIRRRQALRRVGVMLEEQQCQQGCTCDKCIVRRNECKGGCMMWAGNKAKERRAGMRGCRR